jgi:hypothetical protein
MCVTKPHMDSQLKVQNTKGLQREHYESFIDMFLDFTLQLNL